MSLENPNIIDRTITAAKTFKYWRVVGSLTAFLVLIGLVLFTVDRCGTWRTDRKNEQLKENVNIALSNVAAREKVIANLKEQQAVEVFAVNNATREYLDAQNLTDETRREVNKALANLANAAKSNGNISVRELEDKLRGL